MNSGVFTPRVLLFRERGLLSALIRWQTRSIYSHAALLIAPDLIIESWPGVGVRTRKLKKSDWAHIDAFAVPGMHVREWDAALRFCFDEMGSPYAWLGVLRFVTRTPDNEPGWFCSELVFAALQSAGHAVLSRCKAWQVSPALLALSPHLVPAEQAAGR